MCFRQYSCNLQYIHLASVCLKVARNAWQYHKFQSSDNIFTQIRFMWLLKMEFLTKTAFLVFFSGFDWVLIPAGTSIQNIVLQDWTGSSGCMTSKPRRCSWRGRPSCRSSSTRMTLRSSMRMLRQRLPKWPHWLPAPSLMQRWWYRRPRARSCISSTRSASAQRMRPRLKLWNKCDACSRTLTTQRGLKIHAARWCDDGVTQRSRRRLLADRAVRTAKRRVAESLLSQMYVSNTWLEKVYAFEYLGARMQCDGADDTDVHHRMAIAHTTFGSLSSIYGQNTGCRARWSWGRIRLLCVRRWNTHLKPGRSLSQWCAVWTVLTSLPRPYHMHARGGATRPGGTRKGRHRLP